MSSNVMTYNDVIMTLSYDLRSHVLLALAFKALVLSHGKLHCFKLACPYLTNLTLDWMDDADLIWI